MKLKFLQFSAILVYALVMGVFWGTWFAQSRTMEVLSAATFMENGRQYIANLAMPMRFLMPGCLALTFLTLFFLKDWKSKGERPTAFYGTLAAGMLMMAALAVTLSVNVPIDDLIKTWTPETLPADWAGIRDRWEAFHVLRTWISIAGFAALVGGTLFQDRSAPGGIGGSDPRRRT